MSNQKRVRLQVEPLEDRLLLSANPSTGELVRLPQNPVDSGRAEIHNDMHAVAEAAHAQVAHGLFHNTQEHSVVHNQNHLLVHDPVHYAIHDEGQSLIHNPSATHQHNSEKTPRQKKLQLAADYVNGLIDRDVLMMESGSIVTPDELAKLTALKNSQKNGYREHMLANDIRIETIIM